MEAARVNSTSAGRSITIEVIRLAPRVSNGFNSCSLALGNLSRRQVPRRQRKPSNPPPAPFELKRIGSTPPDLGDLGRRPRRVWRLYQGYRVAGESERRARLRPEGRERRRERLKLLSRREAVPRSVGLAQPRGIRRTGRPSGSRFALFLGAGDDVDIRLGRRRFSRLVANPKHQRNLAPGLHALSTLLTPR